jgi:hypothetical protein
MRCMQQPQTQVVYDLFNGRVQFVVPVYQRAYVWNANDNWSVLWDDIADVAQRYLDDPSADPPQKHFLGPIVLDQQPSEVGGIDRRLVIDGQQRLTTLQVLLSAAIAAFEDLGAAETADEMRGLVTNQGRAAAGERRFKVWPSRRDRDAFRGVLDGTSVTDAHPLAAGWQFFRARVEEWVTLDGEATADEMMERAEVLRICLDGLLYFVSINLDATDNAQVIFETLNARGTGLGALDLVKNAALLAAEREQEAVESLNDDYWEATFELDDYWQQEVRQGRIRRPRSDWFLMHWLAMRLGRVVRVDTLFDTFRKEILHGGEPMIDLIPELCRDARIMRSFDDFEDGTPDKLFFDRMDVLDTTTMLPFALLLYRSTEVTSERRLRALQALESWLVRRAILKLQTRAYNRQLARLLELSKRHLDRPDEVVIAELLSSDSNIAVWPSDDAVSARLLDGDLYGYLTQARVRMLLEACEMDIRDQAMTEQVALPGNLTIEHAMPRSWEEQWPLPTSDDPVQAAQFRDAHVHRLGNLTLVTQPLNSALTNNAWERTDGRGKRAALAAASVLLINQQLTLHTSWGENEIDARGADLTRRILRSWPRPASIETAGYSGDEALSSPVAASHDEPPAEVEHPDSHAVTAGTPAVTAPKTSPSATEPEFDPELAGEIAADWEPLHLGQVQGRGNIMRDKYGAWLTGPARRRWLRAIGRGDLVGDSYTHYRDGTQRSGS